MLFLASLFPSTRHVGAVSKRYCAVYCYNYQGVGVALKVGGGAHLAWGHVQYLIHYRYTVSDTTRLPML